MQKLGELELASTLGAEKTAIRKAAGIAEELGFSPDRIEDLKTAVAEACTNAIEHGNNFAADTKVRVAFAADECSLQVVVTDHGEKFDPEPLLQKGIADDDFPTRRGYGLFLIGNLVDDFSFEYQENGNSLTMLIHHRK